MGFLEIVAIAVGLAMDSCAVSLGSGVNPQASGYQPALRMSFGFGLFQALMPVIGWFAGFTIEPLIAAFDHWIAFGLLAFVGMRMIRSGLNPEIEAHAIDPSRGIPLLMLCVATSIDALAVGLSLAVLRVQIWYPAIVIGIITMLLSFVGARVGSRLGCRFGKRMEIIGGIILIGIGIRVVVTHFLS
jgi:putative Mn2+ efflux pump MntP